MILKLEFYQTIYILISTSHPHPQIENQMYFQEKVLKN